MAKNKPALYDFSTYLQAGINPKTGLPIKMDNNSNLAVKDSLGQILKVMDEQDAINSFVWFNLPEGLDSELIERMLYYKGQICFFYIPEEDRFYALPYALAGTIDVYGRFNDITPVPFAGGTADNEDEPWIPGLTRHVVKTLNPEVTLEDFNNGCVLLWDYSKRISQTNLSRNALNDPLINLMSEAVPLARTSLIANSGVNGMRVNDADQASNVNEAAKSVYNAAITGHPWVPIVGNIEFQELTGVNSLKSEEYLLYLQSLDNLRLSTHGLGNGGLFQKKSHVLEAEQDMNAGNIGLVLQDRLLQRQRFCNIVNNIWDLGIWCEVSETALGVDANMDGMVKNDDTSISEGGQEDEVLGQQQ